jgi:hypothetical protein
MESAPSVAYSATGAVTIYRRHNKPALGPVGDSAGRIARATQNQPSGLIGFEIVTSERIS